jgi:hypothetical protein
VSNENRSRAARSGWTRRRAAAQSDSVEAGAEAASPDAEAVYRAYRDAKARHDAAITALRAAAGRGAPADPELVRRQAEAAVEEIEALAAVRALVKAPVKPDDA